MPRCVARPRGPSPRNRFPPPAAGPANAQRSRGSPRPCRRRRIGGKRKQQRGQGQRQAREAAGGLSAQNQLTSGRFARASPRRSAPASRIGSSSAAPTSTPASTTKPDSQTPPHEIGAAGRAKSQSRENSRRRKKRCCAPRHASGCGVASTGRVSALVSPPPPPPARQKTRWPGQTRASAHPAPARRPPARHRARQGWRRHWAASASASQIPRDDAKLPAKSVRQRHFAKQRGGERARGHAGARIVRTIDSLCSKASPKARER